MSNVTTYLHAWCCTDAYMTSATTIFKIQIYNIILYGTYTMLQKSRYKNKFKLLSFSSLTYVVVLKRLGINPILYNIIIHIIF